MNKLYLLFLLLFSFSFYYTTKACNISVTANKGSICLGKLDTLNVTGATTYTWQPTGSNNTSLIVSPLATTTYTVYSTGAGGCLDTATVTVTVNPLPVLVTASVATTPVCQGLSPVLSGAGATTYKWQPGNYSGNPYNALPNNNTIYTVTGATAAGCTKTATVLALVTPAPKPYLLDSTANATFGLPFSNCNNSTGNPAYNLTVNPGTFTGITSYNLNWGNGSATITGLTATNFPQYITYPAYGVYSITLTANYSNGCTRDSVIKVINQTNPAIGISNISGNTAGCAPVGYWFRMSNYQSNAAGTYYVWNFGDGTPPITWTTVTTDSIYHVFNISSCLQPNNEFVVSIDAINSCDNTPATVGSIKIYKKPIPTFNISPSIACVNTVVNFANNSSPAQNGPNCNSNSNYVWNFGDGSPTIVTTSLVGVTHTYTATGTYNVSLKATGSCGTDSLVQPFCVEDNKVNLLATPTSLCVPAAITLNNTSPSFYECGTSPFTWSITKILNTCSVDSTNNFTYTSGNSTATMPTLNINNQGDYRFKLSHTNACGTVYKDTVIYFKRKPKVTFNMSATTCEGTTVNLNAIATNCGAQPLTYLWNGPTTGTTNASTAIVYNAPGNYTVSVGVTNECGTTTVIDNITVNPKPVLTIIPNPNDTICAGNTVTLTASGANNYSWSNGSNMANTSVSPISNNTYTVTGTNAFGCSATKNITIVINPKPTITIINTVPTCVPGNDAIITATVTNGSAPFTYQLNNGIAQASNIFNNVGIGNYTIVVTDSKGCTGSTVKNIAAPNSPNIVSFIKNNVTCNGINNGLITFNINGGTGTINYTLMPGSIASANPTYTGLTIGNYTVIATDANGCSTLTTFIISQPLPLTFSNLISGNVLCNNGNTGSIAAIAVGGNSSYTFNLQPSNTNNSSGSFNNLAANNYTVKVTDNKGCTYTSTISINEPTALQIDSVLKQNLFCNNASTGSISIYASGGTGAKDYILNPGNIISTSGVYNNLQANTYTIIASDGNNCTKSTIVNITQPLALNFSAVTSTNPSCVPGNDGSISATASGGVGALLYKLNAGTNQAAGNFSLLNTGTYTITITDGNNCTKTTTKSIAAPNAPILNTISVTNINCFGQNTGSIVTAATGGTGLLTFTKLPISASNTTGTFNTLIANNYSITVTDVNGCSSSLAIAVTQPNALSWSLAVALPESCTGSNNGSINTTVAGGVAPFNYVLMPGNLSNNTGTYNPLGGGTYTVTTTDNKGCTISTTLMVGQAPSLVIDSLVLPAPTCNNSSITVYANGGSMPYQYKNGTSTYVSTNVFNSLLANTYTITVKDANGCTTTGTKQIVLPNAPAINSYLVKNISCNGLSNGSIYNYTAIGGAGAYVYNVLPSGNFTNLLAGNYTLTVTDANNCIGTTAIAITQPAALTISNLAANNITCNNLNNGQIQTTAIGGSGTKYFKLLPNNIINTLGTFSNLSANVYTVSVTDDSLCSNNAVITITNPAVLQFASLSITSITCNGLNNGSIVGAVTGGTGLYNFTLSSPTNTLNNTTGTFSNLYAATYTYTVTDANGCNIDTIFTFTQPSPVSGSYIVQQNVTCIGQNNGAFTVFSNSGIAPFTYYLLGGTQFNTTGVFNSKAAGTYSVQIVDANNCIATIAPIIITQPTPIIFTATVVPTINCFGDKLNSFTTTASGGTNTLTYNIMPNGPQTNATGTFTQLSAQAYTITAIDGNNCNTSTTIIVNQNPKLIFNTIIINNPLCFGDSNGKVSGTIIGGVAPYVFNINGNNIGSTLNFNNLKSGTYNIKVTDAKGCSADTNIVLNATSAYSITLANSAAVNCINTADGVITIKASGGVGGFIYGLLPDSVTNTSGIFNNLNSGTYTVFVKDANNCALNTILVVDPVFSPMQINITQQDLDCIGNGKEGWAQANIFGGAQPYSYLWSTNPPQYSQQAVGLNYGYVTVITTDAKGCTISDTTYIKPGNCCTEIFFPNAFTPNEDGVNDIFIPQSNTGIELISFAVYSRLGQRIWQANALGEGWTGFQNGTPFDNGVYYYVYNYRCTYDGKTYLNSGDVQIVR